MSHDLREKETEKEFPRLDIDWIGLGLKMGVLAVTLFVAYSLYSMVNEDIAAQNAIEQAKIDQGWQKVDGLSAKYVCPNDNWTGYPGAMDHYETGFFSNPHFICPECGYEFSEVTGEAVWVNAEGVYQERA